MNKMRGKLPTLTMKFPLFAAAVFFNPNFENLEVMNLRRKEKKCLFPSIFRFFRAQVGEKSKNLMVQEYSQGLLGVIPPSKAIRQDYSTRKRLRLSSIWWETRLTFRPSGRKGRRALNFIAKLFKKEKGNQISARRQEKKVKKNA